ncbi:MAG: nucleotidyltransferase domain-containing protein [Bdellovibrionota bacterium]
MIDQATIQKAVEILRDAARPRKIILFGSYARGDAREGSDLDFLVVEDRVASRRREMVRLDDALGKLRIPADVLVASREQFDEGKDCRGTVYHQAARHGRVVYESP